MISSKLREYLDNNMKNMEVIPVRSSHSVRFAADSHEKSGPTIEQLRNKYLSEDYQLPVTSNENKSKDEDDVEVVLLKKKNSGGQDHNETSAERTIIGSSEKGILGSQG